MANAPLTSAAVASAICSAPGSGRAGNARPVPNWSPGAELEATTEAGREAELPVIGIDTLDAIELGEIVDYVGEWLEAAAPAVTASLEDYGGGPGAREILVEALARHGRALLGSVPA